MINIGLGQRITAAVAALGVNLTLALGLTSLAERYAAEAQAAPLSAPVAGEVVAARCRPERAVSG